MNPRTSLIALVLFAAQATPGAIPMPVITYKGTSVARVARQGTVRGEAARLLAARPIATREACAAAAPSPAVFRRLAGPGATTWELTTSVGGDAVHVVPTALETWTVEVTHRFGLPGTDAGDVQVKLPVTCHYPVAWKATLHGVEVRHDAWLAKWEGCFKPSRYPFREAAGRSDGFVATGGIVHRKTETFAPYLAVPRYSLFWRFVPKTSLSEAAMARLRESLGADEAHPIETESELAGKALDERPTIIAVGPAPEGRPMRFWAVAELNRSLQVEQARRLFPAPTSSVDPNRPCESLRELMDPREHTPLARTEAWDAKLQCPLSESSCWDRFGAGAYPTADFMARRYVDLEWRRVEESTLGSGKPLVVTVLWLPRPGAAVRATSVRVVPAGKIETLGTVEMSEANRERAGLGREFFDAVIGAGEGR